MVNGVVVACMIKTSIISCLNVLVDNEIDGE